ncbi:MAG: PCYCGC motif-containing (lipo)protein [Bellilinea sp.]
MTSVFHVHKNKFPALMLTVLGIVTVLLAACSPNGGGAAGDLKMAPMADMPAEVQDAAVTVREAYQFAAANPDVLQNLPCYCGCGPMGHTSNYSCYVQSAEGKEIVFDTHALGCGICVDITQDAMRMLRDGKTMPEIRAAIDADYSRFGPSNMP